MDRLDRTHNLAQATRETKQRQADLDALAKMKEKEAELIKAGKLKRIPCKYNVIIHGLEDSRFKEANEKFYNDAVITDSARKHGRLLRKDEEPKRKRNYQKVTTKENKD